MNPPAVPAPAPAAPQRIVFVAKAQVHLLDALPHTTLGHLNGGVWAGVSNAALLHLLRHKARPPILYYTRAEYDYAMRRLPPSEIENVIRKWLDVHTMNVYLNGSGEVVFRGHESLILSALAYADTADAAKRKVLAAHFEATLRLLADPEYKLTSFAKELLGELPFQEARVIEEDKLAQEEAQRDGEAQTAHFLAEDAARHHAFGRALCLALKQAGQGDFGDFDSYLSSPDLVRSVFIRPRDPEFLASLRRQGQGYVLWQDGVLTESKTRYFDEIKAEGRTVTVMYYDRVADGFVIEDTHAQVEVTLDERRQGGDAALKEERQDYLNSLRLKLQLSRRETLAAAQKDKAWAQVCPLLRQQIEQEAVLLRDALARHPGLQEAPLAVGSGGSLPAAPPPRQAGAALVRLAQLEAAGAEEASFFAELAQVCRNVREQAYCTRLLHIKHERLAALRALLPN